MPSLFRYLPEEYLDAFVKRGEILFRSLSYYRDYENDGVRGDHFEGTRVHRPDDGLKAIDASGKPIIFLPNQNFESKADEDHIYVSCMSTECEADLATKFRTNVCVEIQNTDRFIERLAKAISKVLGKNISKQLVYGPVTYYTYNEKPMGDWALPEKIALSKLTDFIWQKEFRIAFPTNGAFDVYNVKVKVVSADMHQPSKQISYAKMIYSLGDLSALCKIHRF